jgi:hypothetical protein
VNLAIQRYVAELAEGMAPGTERRAANRRSDGLRRIGERRNPVRANAGRRIQFSLDRRIAERRGHEGRESWRVFSPRTLTSR